MAEFSKQYCMKYDPELPWHFNLDTEFDRLNNGEMAGIICEGYGFVAIGKESNGTKVCVFVDAQDKYVKVPFVAIDENTHLRVKGKI